MSTPKAAEPRRFVRMFKPRFARLVEAGAKRQTVRPLPERVPRPGDVIDCREWEGKPYRSKQRKLGDWTLTRVEFLELRSNRLIYLLTIGSHTLYKEECEAFARADGFAGFYEMVEWFEKTHGLPFHGIVHYW